MTVLILSRREAECICLGEDIVLTIVAVGNDKVRIGVQAPPGIRILRNELEITAPTTAIDAAQSPTTLKRVVQSSIERKAAAQQPPIQVKRAA
jgi:carbon storage regulator